MLLVEHIVSSVVPVNKALGVTAWLLYGLGGIANNWCFRNCGRAMPPLVNIFVGSWKVHFMGIYYLWLLLHVESVFVIFDVCLLVHVAIILLVIGEHIFGIGIAHESVSASLEPSLILITGGQFINWRNKTVKTVYTYRVSRPRLLLRDLLGQHTNQTFYILSRPTSPIFTQNEKTSAYACFYLVLPEESVTFSWLPCLSELSKGCLLLPNTWFWMDSRQDSQRCRGHLSFSYTGPWCSCLAWLSHLEPLSVWRSFFGSWSRTAPWLDVPTNNK